MYCVPGLRLYSVVMSGEVACCSVVCGTLVGVSVFSMCSELLIMAEISGPLWSSVCEYQSVECAFTHSLLTHFSLTHFRGLWFTSPVSIQYVGDGSYAVCDVCAHGVLMW